jgi:LacI family transcriptional regulator
VQGGYLIAKKLMQSGTMPPVLITASDEQAFGVTKAVMDRQMEIPAALALASLKDSPVTSILNPPLTALELPSHRLGLMAARMLFDCIEGEETMDEPQEVILEPTVKVRRSCGNTNPIYEMFG